MSRTETWMKGQINQNAVLRLPTMAVVSQFGTKAPSAGQPRKRSRQDTKFVVGETRIGGEERV
jgi:hypothetical protein